jgi:hypothetical protein
MNDCQSRRTSSVSLGVALVIVGSFFLIFSYDIAVPPMSRGGDPGPRFVPQVLGVVVLLAGFLELAFWARGRPKQNRQGPSPQGWISRDGWRVLTFAGILLVYALSVPLAFYTSTFVFSAFTMWYLGARWWVAASIAAVIDVVVWGLFVRLFMVPLPTLLDWLPALSIGL